MKKTFLDSLAGKSVADAQKAVFLEGHEMMTVEHGAAIALVVMPNTVILWENEDGTLVAKATAGDDREVVEVKEAPSQ